MFTTGVGGAGVRGRWASSGWGAVVLAAILLLGAGGYTAMAQVEPAGVLSVTPADDFECDGLPGEITGKTKTYTLTNTGTGPLEWKVTWNGHYWSFSTPGGTVEQGQGETLEAGASVAVTARLGGMPPSGDNPAYGHLYFTNVTNGAGSTSRNLFVLRRYGPEMRVGGGNGSGVWILGDTVSSVYVREWTVTNPGGPYISWGVQVDQPWLTLDWQVTDYWGGGWADARVNVQANALPIGTYTATLTFNATGNGLPDSQQHQTRTVTLKVVWPGDINADFAVDVADLLSIVASWNKTSSQSGYNSRCDINHDNTVDMADLLLFMENWGQTLE